MVMHHANSFAVFAKGHDSDEDEDNEVWWRSSRLL